MSKARLGWLTWAGGLGALLLIVLYSAGVLTTGKVSPGRETAPAVGPAPARSGQASLVQLPENYEAVGTVRPLSEITVEAQVPARVQKILVRAGQAVAPGDLLVSLDDAQYRARHEQARQGLNAALAALERAKAEYQRVQRFAASEAATRQSLEQAKAAFLAAEAGVGAARKQVEEAEITLGYTQVRASRAGQVVRRMAEPGDLALPGRPLLMIQTGGQWRLEALVREGLVDLITPGRDLRVAVPSLNGEIKGRVEEIVPTADPQTRSFLVKVGLEDAPGLRAGMFGRLLVPVGQRPAVLVPREAVERIGQLETVRLRTAQGWRRVYVTTGQVSGSQVEVLSGLKGGEEIALGGGDDA